MKFIIKSMFVCITLLLFIAGKTYGMDGNNKISILVETQEVSDGERNTYPNIYAFFFDKKDTKSFSVLLDTHSKNKESLKIFDEFLGLFNKNKDAEIVEYLLKQDPKKVVAFFSTLNENWIKNFQLDAARVLKIYSSYNDARAKMPCKKKKGWSCLLKKSWGMLKPFAQGIIISLTLNYTLNKILNRGITVQVENLDKQAGNFGERIGNAEKQLGNFGKQMGNIEKQVGTLGERTGNIEKQVGNFGKQMGNIDKQAETIGKRMGNIEKQAGNFGKQIGEQVTLLKDTIVRVGGLKNIIGQHGQRLDAIERNGIISSVLCPSCSIQ